MEYKYRKGDIHPETGMIFWGYRYYSPNKELWYTPEKFEETSQKRKEYCKSEAIVKSNANRYYKNRETRLAYSAKYKKDRDALKLALYSTKGTAKRRQLDFLITYEDLVTKWKNQNGKCYYTNVDMLYEYNSKRPNQLSIDRVDSFGHYTNDNVVLCCQSINLAKRDYSKEEFNNFLKEIVKVNKEKIEWE